MRRSLLIVGLPLIALAFAPGCGQDAAPPQAPAPPPPVATPEPPAPPRVATPEPPAPPSASRVRVSVRATGYEPATINAAAGQPITIVFNRVDDGGCGGEVVFPEQNIRRTLPAGQDVEVTLTPQAAGEIHFACGMDMMHGTIVASR